jgi:CubicO group peptidase (beta-lactamase class C family)
VRAFIWSFVLGLSIFCSIAPADVNDGLLQTIVARAKATGSDSLVIKQNGRVVVSDFFGKGDRVRNVQSVTKSIAALAIGLLHEQGMIASYDLPMSTWIPDWAHDPLKSRITLRMLMNHTSGLPAMVDGLFEAPDVIQAAARAELVGVPGAQHLYSNAGAMLLQTVITQASGEPLETFVNRHLFAPLGIFDARWKRDLAGHEMTSGGLSVSTQDLVAIGEMLLARGRYLGFQIMAEETIRELTTRSQTYFDYGLLFWLNHAAGADKDSPFVLISAMGWGGQFISIYPERGVVAIRTRDPLSIDYEKIDEQYFRDFRELMSSWH